jgi:hypothetical protein
MKTTTYIRITIHLRDNTKRSGVRSFSSDVALEDVRRQAWQLSAEVLGHAAIEDVSVKELPPDDPSVVALILRDQSKSRKIPSSKGERPFLKPQQRKPLH